MQVATVIFILDTYLLELVSKYLFLELPNSCCAYVESISAGVDSMKGCMLRCQKKFRYSLVVCK